MTLTVLVIPPPVTVMVAVWLPTATSAVFTLAVNEPLFEPDVGLTVSQDAFLLTVHDPFELTVID